MKKSRFFYPHPDTNKNKFIRLDELHIVYVLYVKECLNILIKNRRINPKDSELKILFNKSKLLHDVQSEARFEAVKTIKSWAALKYTLKLKRYLYLMFKTNKIDELTMIKLRTIGKYCIDNVNKLTNKNIEITQNDIDTYLNLLFDEKIYNIINIRLLLEQRYLDKRNPNTKNNRTTKSKDSFPKKCKKSADIIQPKDSAFH